MRKLICRLVQGHRFFFDHSRDYVGNEGEYRRGVRGAYLRFMLATLKDTI